MVDTSVDVYQLSFQYPSGFPDGPIVLVLATSMVDALSSVMAEGQYDQYSSVMVTAIARDLGPGSDGLDMTDAAAQILRETTP